MSRFSNLQVRQVLDSITDDRVLVVSPLSSLETMILDHPYVIDSLSANFADAEKIAISTGTLRTLRKSCTSSSAYHRWTINFKHKIDSSPSPATATIIVPRKKYFEKFVYIVIFRGNFESVQRKTSVFPLKPAHKKKIMASILKTPAKSLRIDDSVTASPSALHSKAASSNQSSYLKSQAIKSAFGTGHFWQQIHALASAGSLSILSYEIHAENGNRLLQASKIPLSSHVPPNDQAYSFGPPPESKFQILYYCLDGTFTNNKHQSPVIPVGLSLVTKSHDIYHKFQHSPKLLCLFTEHCTSENRLNYKYLLTAFLEKYRSNIPLYPIFVADRFRGLESAIKEIFPEAILLPDIVHLKRDFVQAFYTYGKMSLASSSKTKKPAGQSRQFNSDLERTIRNIFDTAITSPCDTAKVLQDLRSSLLRHFIHKPVARLQKLIDEWSIILTPILTNELHSRLSNAIPRHVLTSNNVTAFDLSSNVSESFNNSIHDTPTANRKIISPQEVLIHVDDIFHKCNISIEDAHNTTGNYLTKQEIQSRFDESEEEEEPILVNRPLEYSDNDHEEFMNFYDDFYEALDIVRHKYGSKTILKTSDGSTFVLPSDPPNCCGSCSGQICIHSAYMSFLNGSPLPPSEINAVPRYSKYVQTLRYSKRETNNTSINWAGRLPQDTSLWVVLSNDNSVHCVHSLPSEKYTCSNPQCIKKRLDPCPHLEMVLSQMDMLGSSSSHQETKRRKTRRRPAASTTVCVKCSNNSHYSTDCPLDDICESNRNVPLICIRKKGSDFLPQMSLCELKNANATCLRLEKMEWDKNLRDYVKNACFTFKKSNVIALFPQNNYTDNLFTGQIQVDIPTAEPAKCLALHLLHRTFSPVSVSYRTSSKAIFHLDLFVIEIRTKTCLFHRRYTGGRIDWTRFQVVAFEDITKISHYQSGDLIYSSIPQLTDLQTFLEDTEPQASPSNATQVSQEDPFLTQSLLSKLDDSHDYFSF